MRRHRGMLITALLMTLVVLVGCSSTVSGTGPYSGDAFEPNEEVDEIRWLAPSEATEL